MQHEWEKQIYKNDAKIRQSHPKNLKELRIRSRISGIEKA